MLGHDLVRRSLFPISLGLAGLLGLAAPAASQTLTESYDLVGVLLLPDLSHPGSSAQPMSGSFEWTYTVGDFENGTGEFTSLSVPWWSSGLAELEATFEPKAIEIVMPLNLHDHGFDLTLVFEPPLAPGQVSVVDPSSHFDIEVGISHKGHAISGEAVPVTSTWTDEGSALAGAAGEPLLQGTGSLEVGSATSIDLSLAAPDASAGLFVALSSSPVGFKGGTLLPVPWTSLFLRTTAPDGSFGIPFAFPAGVPSGTEIWLQWAITDAGAPAGVALSNGLRGVTP